MAPFDHRDVGSPASLWQQRLADLPRMPLPDEVSLIVLAAHPDDETLGVGGVIATAAHRGCDIEVVIATDGEKSHPESSTHSAAAMAVIRRAEATAAISALAPMARVAFLGLPDGELSTHGRAIEAALTATLSTEGTDRGAIWLLAPWLGDRHPDHAACATAARNVSATHPDLYCWEYPIWLWHWGEPRDCADEMAGMHSVELSTQAMRAKDLAMGCYRSQTHALSTQPGDEPVLSEAFLAHFRRPYDVLIQTSRVPEVTGAFDVLYAESADPWGFATRWYEQRKRDLVLASLPRQRFDRAFEPGCATGLLTAELGRRCSSVLAVDVASRAVEHTLIATADLPGVEVATMDISTTWPDGRFDLIVLSEIAYYLDLATLCRHLNESLTADGVLVLCHWRHPAPAHLHTAEHTHSAIRAETGLNVLASHVEADFLLDVLTTDPRSVARRDGIVG